MNRTIAALIFVLCASSQLFAQVPLYTVALTGRPTPIPGTTYGSFAGTYSEINAAGNIFFNARLAGAAVTSSNDSAYFAGPAGGFVPFIREGDPAPGLPASTTLGQLTDFGPGGFSDSGFAAMTVRLAGPSITANNDQATYMGTPGNVSLLIAEGSQAIGLAAGSTYNFSLVYPTPALNAAGKVTFRAGLSGFVNGVPAMGLWSGMPGNLSLLAGQGMPAPGTSSNYVGFGISATLVNTSGQLVYDAHISDSDRGLWINSGGGAATLIAKSGQLAPGTSQSFSFVSDPSMNDAGEVAFYGQLAPGETGTWAGKPGALSLVTRNGSVAPGTSSGVTFDWLSDPVINSTGTLAIPGALKGPGITENNNEGLWVGKRGALILACREGSQAPGTPTGVVFAGLPAPPSLNDLGQVLFASTLSGPGVTIANDRAVFTTDSQGNLRLVVRKGDQFDVGNGDLRTISTFTINLKTGGEDGRGVSLNPFGDIVLTMTFTDGSGGVFSTIAPVPEPDTWSIGAIGFVAVAISARASAKSRRVRK